MRQQVGYHDPVTLRIAPTVYQALRMGRSVVALESALITHGLPWPRNLELAHHLEETVCGAGAVPATVGILRGVPVVGLSRDELAVLANGGADKVSLWNLPTLLGRDAGTTVAATLQIAQLAGIRVFATGGIGGVHHDSYDVSADLSALARFPLLTVCSGPKSILNVEATLERLESYGVPTIGYRSSRLAGFYLPETDLPLPVRLDTPEAVAHAFINHLLLGGSGFVVSNPVSEGLAGGELEGYLNGARRDAAAAGVYGKDTTPFLLARLADLSGGRTVEVNLRLLVENAALAARIATSLAERAGEGTLVSGVLHE